MTRDAFHEKNSRAYQMDKNSSEFIRVLAVRWQFVGWTCLVKSASLSNGNGNYIARTIVEKLARGLIFSR